MVTSAFVRTIVEYFGMKPPPTIAARLAGFASGLSFDAIPGEVRTRAKHLILDAVGCALAARRFYFAAPSLAALAELGGAGPHAVIGQSLRLPLRDAVLANGILAHGLDYDDTHTEGVVHLTVGVFPAVLALASHLNRSGKDALCAYIAGIEAGARLGSVARGGFHQVGFHPTGVVGAFAAALSAGRLFELKTEALVNAQGVALSVAAGSLEFLEDGAWTKRFHPGWAGVGGITAATMARHGFVAPSRSYEGRFGLFALYLKDFSGSLERAVHGLGDTWETMNVAVKPYPACHFVHAFADAALALRKQGASPESIEAITALVPAEVVKTVCEPQANKKRPANDYDAKFSVPYVIAASLAAGKFGLAQLEASALRDPRILALADKVSYEVDPASGFPQHYSGEVIVRMNDGREMRHREPVNRGAADRPLTNEEVVAKYMENAAFAVPEHRAHRIRDAILGLDEGAMAPLETLLGEAS
jgi:2-methylcitrate dehydratase PrpD